MDYKRILVAVDTTDDADEILAAAKNFVGEEDGVSVRLYGLTVISPLVQVYGGFDLSQYSVSVTSFEQSILFEARNSLEHLAAEYGINDVTAVIGKPSTEIHRFAEEHAIDLVIVGTHGRHGTGLLLGSTANAVLHGAKCDVLAVKIHNDPG